MIEEKISPFNPVSNKEYLFLFAILIYIGFHGYVNNLYNPTEGSIGYTDFVARSYPLDNWLQGKVFFQDFFYFYGPLFAFVQLPFYYLLGANHFALLANTEIIMPLLSIFLAHLYIRIFVKVPFLRISFILVCLFHETIGLYQGSRHITAELTLALFFFCLTRPDKKFWLFFTGIMQGVSILMDPSYGIALFITVCATFTLFFITSTKNHTKVSTEFFLFGLLLSLAPFVFHMIYHGVLISYLKEYYFYATSYVGTGPPGRNAMFPTFPTVSLANLSGSLNHLLLSEAFRQYLSFLFFVAAGLVFLVNFCRGKNPTSFKYFLLACYGLLIFPRSFLLPAYGYMAYGFVPAITIGFLFLEKIWLCSVPHYTHYNCETGYNPKNLFGFTVYTTIVLLIFTWFTLTLHRKDLFVFNPTQPSEIQSTDMIYYEKVGFKISKEAYDQYTKINNYIEKNVGPEEYILTFPWGFYSHFTGRTDALAAYDAAYGVATKRQAEYAVKQLKERRPQYVVLNTLNGSGAVSIGKGNVNQISWQTDNTPVFANMGHPVIIYILENYHIHKKFKYATILKKNKNKKLFDRTFLATEVNEDTIEKLFIKRGLNHGHEQIQSIPKNGLFNISNRTFRIEYLLKEPQYATHVELKFLLHKNKYKKILTKSRLRFGIIDSNTETTLVGCCNQNHIYRELALGGPNINDMTDINKIKTKIESLGVPNKKSLKKISSIWIELKSPQPYLMPDGLSIISLKLLYDKRIK